MLETIENVVSGIGSLIETVGTFFSNILTFFGMLFDAVLYGLKLLTYIIGSGGVFGVAVSLAPAFLLPFVLFALLKAVLNLVK